MNLVAGLFVDPEAERGFDRIYRRVIGRATTFADEAYEAKRRVMRIDLASELQRARSTRSCASRTPTAARAISRATACAAR